MAVAALALGHEGYRVPGVGRDAVGAGSVEVAIGVGLRLGHRASIRPGDAHRLVGGEAPALEGHLGARRAKALAQVDAWLQGQDGEHHARGREAALAQHGQGDVAGPQVGREYEAPGVPEGAPVVGLEGGHLAPGAGLAQVGVQGLTGREVAADEPDLRPHPPCVAAQLQPGPEGHHLEVGRGELLGLRPEGHQGVLAHHGGRQAQHVRGVDLALAVSRDRRQRLGGKLARAGLVQVDPHLLPGREVVADEAEERLGLRGVVGHLHPGVEAEHVQGRAHGEAATGADRDDEVVALGRAGHLELGGGQQAVAAGLGRGERPPGHAIQVEADLLAG
ncbi:MAG: hypothetical protein HY690_10775 [Chloroflexi bacterium]|nr:hypothetical protein [Chloroflexota bacterium]